MEISVSSNLIYCNFSKNSLTRFSQVQVAAIPGPVPELEMTGSSARFPIDLTADQNGNDPIDLTVESESECEPESEPESDGSDCDCDSGSDDPDWESDMESDMDMDAEDLADEMQGDFDRMYGAQTEDLMYTCTGHCSCCRFNMFYAPF
jgi:hypothetical protein